MTSRYAAAHISPAGPGDARPTALQIIKDENLTGVLSSKTILITGCSSGLGVETARALATTGARLFLTARDLQKAKEVLSDILSPGHIELLHLDLTSFASARSCANEFLEKSQGKLNILICNAGVMRIPTLTKTADGFETQFVINHLAHFLLFQLLKPALLSSVNPEFHSRVVMVSSSVHRNSTIHLGNLNLENGAYDPGKAYAQSKTANIYMANHIERHYSPQGLHGLSLHPGSIATGLLKYIDKQMLALLDNDEFKPYRKSPEQGAATTVYAAVGTELEGKGAIYLENCMVCGPLKERAGILDPGYAKHAFDEEKEERLWKESLKMVGVDDQWDQT
jgi:NAD(P)-dependent dehydrogenase (short-subunit alcohol dehydrogenase family)